MECKKNGCMAAWAKSSIFSMAGSTACAQDDVYEQSDVKIGDI